MKKLIVICLLLSAQLSFAQSGVSAVIHSSQPFPTIPKITVQGYAKKEVVPDQIFFRITLKEDRISRKKTRIDSLENQLYRLLDGFKIPRKNLSLKNNSQRLIYKKRGDNEVEVTRQYTLLVNDKVNLRSLLLSFSENNFHNISISHIDHTKKAEMMEKLRKEAMKNAKGKAHLLLSSIDENVGALLDVKAVGNTQLQFSNLSRVNSSYNSYISGKKFHLNDFNYEKLKLESSFQLVFEIKSNG